MKSLEMRQPGRWGEDRKRPLNCLKIPVKISVKVLTHPAHLEVEGSFGATGPWKQLYPSRNQASWVKPVLEFMQIAKLLGTQATEAARHWVC